MNRYVGQCLRTAALMAILFSSNSASCDDPIAPSATENALDRSVWFDTDRSGIVPVTLVPESDDSINRDSRWLPKAQRLQQSAAPSAPSRGLFGTGYTIANVLAWALLILLAMVVIGFLAFVISKTETPESALAKRRANRAAELPDQQTMQRINHLPTELQRTDVNLRSEAQRLMNARQYDQAIILLYGHQLLLLDHAGKLRLNRGKTNRKYVREMESVDRQSARRLRATVDAFERTYFGRHSISEAEFSELWQSNIDLEKSVHSSPEVAA